jgi:hypothetical protein
VYSNLEHPETHHQFSSQEDAKGSQQASAPEATAAATTASKPQPRHPHPQHTGALAADAGAHVQVSRRAWDTYQKRLKGVSACPLAEQISASVLYRSRMHCRLPCYVFYVLSRSWNQRLGFPAAYSFVWVFTSLHTMPLCFVRGNPQTTRTTQNLQTCMLQESSSLCMRAHESDDEAAPPNMLVWRAESTLMFALCHRGPHLPGSLFSYSSFVPLQCNTTPFKFCVLLLKLVR